MSELENLIELRKKYLNGNRAIKNQILTSIVSVMNAACPVVALAKVDLSAAPSF